jgi:serine/threonine-protein kinase
MEGACARCGAAVNGPFCARDGVLAVERFVIGERYAVESLIGGGGYGFVFSGKHLVLGKPVAVKVLRDRGSDSLAAKRFLREARTASQFGHEHIISILDFGHCATNDVSYLVMEHFPGVTLADVIRTSAPMPVSRALPILIQLADALAAAHAARVLHRDVTPRNVLVGRADFIKLCDFGLSRSLIIDDRVTSSGIVVGTPAYMAPEQIRGEAIDERADIYGLGCTAYEMLTGRVPHAGSTPVALLANRINDGTIDVIGAAGQLPTRLEELLTRCLATDPADRPTAAELVDELPAFDARSARPAEPARRIGNYDVLELIGTGGSGSVYRGKHPLIGTEVAIKVLRPEIAAVSGMAERFIQEARASSDLDDRHIARYFDFGYLDNGQPYAVLELLVGETLSKRLARGRLRLAEVAEIVGQVARAMTRVHAAGLVHRDLKPDNLFLTTDAAGALLVKILDFGIAKVLAPGTSAAQTSFGLTLGTPAYCAPEQALGLAVDQTADIYALGATAFEMLAGRPPFEGTVSRILGAKTTMSAPALDSIAPGSPAAVASTIDRMLAREPHDRHPIMQAVLDELASWPQQRDPVATGAEVGAAVPDETIDPPAPRAAFRARLVLGALAILCLSAAIGVWFAVTALVHGDAPAPVSVPVRALPPATPDPAVPPPAPEPPLSRSPETSPDPPSPPPPTAPQPAAVAPKPVKRLPPRAKKLAPAPDPSPIKRDDGVIVDPFAR